MTDLESIKRNRDALLAVLRDAGATITGARVRCCFHEDKSPSGGIIERDGVWLFSCRACTWNKGKAMGDIFAVVMAHKQCSFAEAKK